MEFPTSNFFLNKLKLRDLSSPSTNDIKDVRFWEYEDKRLFFGKTIPFFSMEIRDPLEIASTLISYDKIHSPILLYPSSVVLPSESFRHHFIILSEVSKEYHTLDSIIMNPSGIQSLGDTKKAIIALGVALGLKELHSHGKAHQYLTTGSILLDEHDFPHIWDSYLSSVVKYDGYTAFAQQRHIFSAPETTFQVYHGTAADVYSFGLILLMLNNSISQYEQFSHITEDVDLNSRVGTKDFIHLISLCLAVDPEARPTFDTIVKMLLDQKAPIFPDADVFQVSRYAAEIIAHREYTERTIDPIKKYLTDFEKLKEEASSGLNLEKTLQFGKHLIEEGEKSTGISFLKKAAKSENPKMMYEYGCALSNSDKNDKDLDAFTYIKAAAEKNYVDAVAKYAELLRAGKGCSKNFPLALNLFRGAANKGCLAAMKGYSEMLHDGEGTSVNLEESFKYLKKAAEIGGPEEHYKLAICYQIGDGTHKDMRRSLENYKIAYEGGCEEAEVFMQEMKKMGEKLAKKPTDIFRKSHNVADVAKSDSLMMYIMMLIIGTPDVSVDTKAAVKLLKIAAQKGYAEAQYEYYKLLKKGDGIQKNEKESIFYLQHSAQNGFVRAQLVYGYHLLTKKKMQDSARLFKQAADNGAAEGQMMYGDMLYNGKGVKANREEGIKYIHLAADQGYPEALYQMGQIIENNSQDDDNSLTKALYYYKRAFSNGVEKSEERIAMLLIKIGKDLEEAGAILEKLVEKDNKDAVYQLALMCMSGEGAKQDFKRAAELFKRGLSLGIQECEFELNKLIFLGLGVQKNVESSLKYFAKCPITELKNMANNIVGYACYQGIGLPEDKPKAIEIWKRIAATGGAEAAYNYAIAIQKEGNAEGMTVFQYLKQSSDAGFPLASFKLAEMMAADETKKSNYTVIQTLYVDAANKGYIPALIKAADNFYQETCPGVDRSVSRALELYKKVANVDIDIVTADEVPEWTGFKANFVISDPYFKSREEFNQEISVAMQKVGEILFNGESGVSDHSLAKSYFEKSSKLGNVEAIFQLGQLYDIGIGVERDREEARRLYGLAAKQGHKFAKLCCSIPSADNDDIDDMLEQFKHIGELDDIDLGTNEALDEILSGNQSNPEFQKALKKLMEQNTLSDDLYFDDLDDPLNKFGISSPFNPFKDLAPLDALGSLDSLSDFQNDDILDEDDEEEEEDGYGTQKDPKSTLMRDLEFFDALAHMGVLHNIKKEPFPKMSEGFIKPSYCKKLKKDLQRRKPVFKFDFSKTKNTDDPKKKSEIMKTVKTGLYPDYMILKQTADIGDPIAQFELATMLENGDGVERDPELAAVYFKKAKDQGVSIEMLQGFLTPYK